MVSSYSETLRVRYVSPTFSKASFFNAFIFLASLIVPYLIGYRSQGFWVKLERFKEQPEIFWKHEVLLILNGEKGQGHIESLVWSTLPGLKSMLGNEISPFISSREGDTNFDSIKEFLDLEVIIPLPQNFTKYAILEMESMIYISHNHGTIGNRFEFYGDIGIVQKEPLWNRYVDKRYNYEVIPRFSSKLEDYSLSMILQRYSHRNVSAILKNNYQLWLNTDAAKSNRKDFIIKGRINYVEETYECWAGFAEVLKWAWVQYFCIFIIVYTVLKQFQGMVYKAKIFDTYLILPWEKRHGTQPIF